MDVVQNIKDFLQSKQLNFRCFEHEPTPTSEISAQVRGTPLSQGAKAMVLRSKGKFLMAVLQASKKIDLKKLRGIIATDSLSFASPDEVLLVTGCKVGGVPPFGNLFNIPVYLDKGMLENAVMDFNAGLQTVSMEMQVQDFVVAVQPIVVDFAV
ncbi:MAG: YbaK/EbsC family protein [Nanoarchaeota archaeon]|nr:YbaK/EbsC family protein [Nanoarchaeota archaeon]